MILLAYLSGQQGCNVSMHFANAGLFFVLYWQTFLLALRGTIHRWGRLGGRALALFANIGPDCLAYSELDFNLLLHMTSSSKQSTFRVQRTLWQYVCFNLTFANFLLKSPLQAFARH